MTEEQLEAFRLQWGPPQVAVAGVPAQENVPPFPTIVNFRELADRPDFRQPEELIEGLLHVGSKLYLAGPAKAKKSWAIHDMALSVASGTPFWGMRCLTPGRVLVADLELQCYFLEQRIRSVASAKRLPEEVFENVDILSLRGHAADAETVMDAVQRNGAPYSLMVIDPIYRLLAGADENAAKDITAVCEDLERVALQAGAAIVVAMHFPKGNAAKKSSIDRIAGSGVYARDADSIVTLTPHKEENHCVAEFTLRNFPQLPELVLGWNHPLFMPNPDLAPFLQETGRARVPFPTERVTELILEMLEDQGPQGKREVVDTIHRQGYPRDPVRALVDGLVAGGRLVAEGQRPVMIRLVDDEAD